MLRNRKANSSTNDTGTTSTSAKIITPESKVKTKEDVPPKLKVWILASRPHTLTASVVPVIVSSAIITYHLSVSPSLSSAISTSTSSTLFSHYILGVLFAVFACLIQLGTNLYNDYSDFIKGADTDTRVGQARATQKGWLTPYETAFGSTLCLAIATILGLYLTFLSSTWLTSSSSTNTNTSSQIDYYMLFVTISSVFNAFCYTGGEYPLGYIGMGSLSIGYSGLGDLFVFLYFGLVATITVPYLFLVQSGTTSGMDIWKDELMYKSFITALPIGFLATAIITVNNLRDRKTDILVGKNTMAVRFGEWFTRIEYIILVVGSYLFLLPLSRLFAGEESGMSIFLPLLSFPLALKELKAVGFGGKDGAALNKHVGGVAKVQLFYSLLLVLGLNIQRLSHS